MLSQTHQRSILRVVEKIRNSSFDENDIKLLLIDIRELVSQKSFTKELAHFIAHPERERGLCYEELSLRALVVKQSINQTRLFSNPVALLSIKKKTFDIIVGIGLRRYCEYDSSMNEASERLAINNCYQYNNKTEFYVLKDIRYIPKVVKFVNTILSTVLMSPVISSDDLIRQLNSDMKSIFKKYLPNKKYDDEIMRHGDDIVLHIFSLFQDVQFRLFDGSSGEFYLYYNEHKMTIERIQEIESNNQFDISKTIEDTFVEEISKATLCLGGNFSFYKTGGMISEFISSNIIVGNHISSDAIRDYVRKPVDATIEQNGYVRFLANFHLQRDEHKIPWIIKNDE